MSTSMNMTMTTIMGIIWMSRHHAVLIMSLEVGAPYEFYGVVLGESASAT